MSGRFVLALIVKLILVALCRADAEADARAALDAALAAYKAKREPLRDPAIPDGAVETMFPGVHQMSGGCLWGKYPDMYQHSLRTGKPLIVHIGKRLDGLCHAATKDGWLHALRPEFMGLTQGIAILIPRNGVLLAAAHIPSPTVPVVVEEVNRVMAFGRSSFPVTLSTTGNLMPAGSNLMSTMGRPGGGGMMMGMRRGGG